MARAYRIVAAVLFHPFPWGALAALGFYAILDMGYVTHPLALRYLSGHWTAMVCVSLFFIGVAGLVLRALSLASEFEALNSAPLDAIPASGQPVLHCAVLLERLAKQPLTWQRTYLVGRLRDSLDYVRRKGSAETLDDQLRYLSDMDALRKHAGYGIVRMMVWAMPFVGCLGTVVGIGGAVANLSPEALDNSLSGIVAGMGMVFDTTALALALSVVLMVLQFVIEQVEGRLLTAVDARVSSELVGRFKPPQKTNDPTFDSMKQLADTMVEASESLVRRQGELWEMGVDAANRRWSDQSSAASQQLETLVAGAVARAMGGSGGAVAGGSQMGHEGGRHADYIPSPHLPVSEEELQNQREVMLELAEVTRQGSKNWPVRKSPHFQLGKLAQDITDGAWLERS